MTNQIAAMLFPLLTVAVVGMVAVFVRRPWKRLQPTVVHKDKLSSAILDELEEASRHVALAAIAAKEQYETRQGSPLPKPPTPATPTTG
jgi:hypothetical protein